MRDAPDDTGWSSSAGVVERLVSNRRRFLEFLTRRVGSAADAEEILQDAFVRSLQNAGEIRDEERAVAWFYRVLRNAIIDHQRRQAAGRRAISARASEAPDSDAIDEELERTVCRCVDDLMLGLKPEYAAMLRSVDLGNATVAAAAADLGITEGNARVRLHRARASLRSEVERMCRTCATHGCLDCTCAQTGA